VGGTLSRPTQAGQTEPNQLNCQELLEQLGDFIDEKDRTELCRQIEEHLEKCPDCRIVVDKTKKTIILYQADRQKDPPGLVAASDGLKAALAQEYLRSPG
jgi:predicted anti-sigma-YlaC factor YlaD